MLPQRVEWPTVAVAVTIWGGGAAVLAVHERLPTLLTILILGVLAAWYGSLQHEVIHGHPTPWRSVNGALAGAPLGLVVPFSTYRATHLAHHRAPELTEPGLDPESFHVSAATWDRCGPLRRTALRALRTLAGRMILGPVVQAATCWTGLADDARKSPRGAIRLVTHLGGVAVVLLVVDAAGMAPWVYVVAVAWVGGALSLLRSFAEHRWTASGTRSAVVHAGPAMALLYLNNNLHHTHHERPGVAWFRLPVEHRRLDASTEAALGAGVYNGYGEVARRYLFRAFDAPVVTSTASPSPVGASVASTPQPATAQ